MPVVSGLLARAYPVARYIDHVIHWRAQFSFMLGFFNHFLRFSFAFSSLSAVLLRFRQLKAFCFCFLEGLSSNMPHNTLNSISALLDPHNPTSSTSGESAPLTMSVSIFLSSFASALSLPSSVSISVETVTGHFPIPSAVTPSNVGGFLVEWSDNCDNCGAVRLAILARLNFYNRNLV